MLDALTIKNLIDRETAKMETLAQLIAALDNPIDTFANEAETIRYGISLLEELLKEENQSWPQVPFPGDSSPV
jgi:hypothetical protein